MAATKAQIAQYFSFNFWCKCAYGLAVVGALFLLDGGTRGVGVLLIAIGAAAAKFKLLDNIPDQAIEDAYKNFAESMYDKAKSDCGINDSMLIQSPDWFWHVDDFHPNKKRFRDGNDNITRANTRGIVILNYGRDQIFGWEVVVNIETGDVSHENTSEYYYNDVVGIEIIQNKELILRTSGGPKEYKLASHEHNESGDVTKGKTVVNAVRTMLRERKST